jgi:hypothetical protein
VKKASKNNPFIMLYKSELYNNEISDGAFRVYLIMCMMAFQTDNRVINATHDSLARITGRTARSIQAYIKELLKCKLIEKLDSISNPRKIYYLVNGIIVENIESDLTRRFIS